MAEIGPGLKKKFTGIVQFDINDVGTWTLDLKTGDGGVVTEGKGKGKPDLVIKVGDADFASLYDGKSNAQQAFMKGRLKVFLILAYLIVSAFINVLLIPFHVNLIS